MSDSKRFKIHQQSVFSAEQNKNNQDINLSKTITTDNRDPLLMSCLIEPSDDKLDAEVN